jgi:hypothetical protein
MNIYGAVAGGILAFTAQSLVNNPPTNDFPVSYTLVFIFLGLLTLFGFFLTLRWIFAFECHRKRVSKLAKELLVLGVSEVPLEYSMDIPPIPLAPKFKNKKKYKWFNKVCGSLCSVFLGTRCLFPIFYLVVLIGITGFVCYLIPDSTWSSKWVLFVIPLFTLLIFIRWYFSLKKAR